MVMGLADNLYLQSEWSIPRMMIVGDMFIRSAFMFSFSRLAVAVVAILAAFTSTGCVSSLKPLSDEKTSKPDVRLLGTWELEDKDKMEKHAVVIQAKKGAPNVLEASATQDGEKETGDLLLTKIGNDHFVSIGDKDDKGVMRYTIAKYVLKDDSTLECWGLNADFFAKAVENKELKGTVKQELFKDVTLDDTPENLRKFLEKQGSK